MLSFTDAAEASSTRLARQDQVSHRSSQASGFPHFPAKVPLPQVIRQHIQVTLVTLDMRDKCEGLCNYDYDCKRLACLCKEDSWAD